MKLAIVTAAVVSLALPLATRAATPDCEPARCAVQSRVATECPCESATNHGRYVSCVAHIVNQLAHDGTIPTNCKGKVTRCAAKSTCGKDGFVTCHIPTDTCDTTTFTCIKDPMIQCQTDLDCGSRCKVSSSGDLCTVKGGTVGTSTSCCADCAD
jgi:hypothetical protein